MDREPDERRQYGRRWECLLVSQPVLLKLLVHVSHLRISERADSDSAGLGRGLQF